ncbi:MAG: endolytic transglycosylase MltG [Candidatus Pacebacteria bacterium]|nr:endolytic transglycosylase MltG [Candidatus Paceibacterota bacterium]
MYKNKYFIRIGLAVLLVGVFLALYIVQISRAPDPFPVNKIVTIPAGVGVSGAGDILAQSGVIRSSFAYKVYTVLIHDGEGIQAGQYLFDKPQSVVRVAYRTAYGMQGLTKIKVTIPEGSSSKDITAIVSGAIPAINKSDLLLSAKAQEGYLFPDTYFFYQNTTPAQVIKEMRANFDEQIKSILVTASLFSQKNKVTMKDIVTMASIVEKEATSTIDRQIIAGVLWKRFVDKYPLQVDPPFFYILGKDSSQITTKDLAIDSPYNLYKNKGLPPTPIDNPGLDALFATVSPTATKYWYYLSDKKGNMHYAVTYEQHLVNKAKWVD